MRLYTPKDNVQKKPYYTDRYWVAPQVPKSAVEEDLIFSEDLHAIQERFEVLDAYIQVGQMVVVIHPADNFGVIELLKNTREYTQLSELSANDYLAQEGTFEIFYQLLSMSKRKRIRVKCKLGEHEAIQSVEPLFRSADWSEREMYDMFGVVINNHPLMKRILMPDDWEGYPLRKSYPLQGDEAAHWYEVDRIFGREARDIIGPEIRDSARIDRYDTERFARLGHEVPRGSDISGGEPNTPIQYQEQGGAFMVEKFTAEKSVVISDRDR